MSGKIYIITNVLLVIVFSTANAQIWHCDFGTGIGVHSSGESLSFLPAPPAGTARVRVGNQGGIFALENPGNLLLGTDSELRISAATGASINKFSAFGLTPGTTSTLRFQCVLSGGAGEWYFFIGSGSCFEGNTIFTSSHVFTGIRFSIDTAGTIALSLRGASGWSAIPAAPGLDSVLTFDVYCNNSSHTQPYNYATPVDVAARSVDIWLNGVRVATSAAKSALPDTSHIDSFMFYGSNSPNNASHLLLDDVFYAPSIAATPLPVQLVMFSAVREERTVCLRWETANELNNYGFVVERRDLCDTCTWSDMVFIPGAGASNVLRSYEWCDSSAPSTDCQYRLRQIDRDASMQHSHIVTVVQRGSSRGDLLDVLYPNPARSDVSIVLRMLAPGWIRLVLYSSTGMRIAELMPRRVLPAGQHHLGFHCSHLPRGRFICVIEGPFGVRYQRLVLL